jgi:hypothetical protein
MIGQLRTMYAQNQVMVNGCAGLNSLHSFLSLYMQKDLLSRGLSITRMRAWVRARAKASLSPLSPLSIRNKRNKRIKSIRDLT